MIKIVIKAASVKQSNDLQILGNFNVGTTKITPKFPIPIL